MHAGDGDNSGEASKPKRVRTGCLTCRERHLKCDEAWPHCQNCRKSNRECKRGIKLNFIDTWCDRPPQIVTLYGTKDWKVEFLDESREIADEYTGGTHVYPPLAQAVPAALSRDRSRENASYTRAAQPAIATAAPQALPPIHGILPDATYMDPTPAQPIDIGGMFDVSRQNSMQHHLQPVTTGTTQHSSYAPNMQDTTMSAPLNNYSSVDHGASGDDNERREYLDSAEETLFMQVFVEEVGVWMDAMDPLKHFSRLLPSHSLSEPMLLHAFLACGARHLTLINSAYSDEKALNYYDTATSYLLKALQNPNRDTVICATTAVILNVYEVMSERALQRMNHIAGARALIKECGWNAKATGIGAACFWLNVGLEVLSCLHFNWQVAWDPDDWQIDMNLSHETHNGREEIWTHRMLYIIAKVCNFRSTMPRSIEPNQRDEQIRAQHRYEQWTRLKGMADAWNQGIPKTMQPMALVSPYHTGTKSLFPEVWLIKRTAIVARLFYHTAMLLLSQINPYFNVGNPGEMADMQTTHAQMICGITAHVKDRGVASIAIRSLAHAGEVITDRNQQEEVIRIFEKINKETGWRIGFVYKELKEKWGWAEEPSPEQLAQTHTAARQEKERQEQQQQQQQQQMQQAHAAQHQQHQHHQNMQQQHQQQTMQLQQGFVFNSQNMAQNMSLPAVQLTPPHQNTPHAQQQQQQQRSQPQQQQQPPGGAGKQNRKIPSGILNPMYAKADFNLPQHPYQDVYVAPSSGYGHPQGGGVWWS